MREFRKTVRALGFRATRADLDAVLHRLGCSGKQGNISYVELHRRLREEAGLPGDGAQSQKVELGPGGESLDELTERLREIVAKNLTAVVKLFTAWDEDESGTIDAQEFWLALRSLGIKVPQSAARALFDSFDADGSGELSYKELNKQLRRRAEIDAKLRKGAAGEIMVKAKNKTALSRTRSESSSRTLHGAILDASKSVTEQLIAAIHKSKARLLQLFLEWDSSGDGRISKKEMQRALSHLGLIEGEQARSAVEELFRRVDKDGSGTIDAKELFAGLKIDFLKTEKLPIDGQIKLISNISHPY